MVMHKIILTTQKIGYEFPHGSLFKNATLTIASNERIGLVGKNGSGKSTLLKILDGTVEPTEGKISSQCVSYYLPQINFSLFNSDEDVKTYVEKHRESWVLIKVALHRWSKTSQIIAEQKIKTLSGGETMMLHLAIAQSKQPDLLLLDEPTNHLDAEGLVILRDFLTSFRGAFVIVSHDPFLLDLVVDHIWELNEGVVRKYGGNYSYYREQKEIEQEAKARDYEATRKEVRKVKRSIALEQKRAVRSRREGRKQIFDKSMSAMEKGYFKNRASASAGRQSEKLKQILEEREERADLLKESRQRKVRLDLTDEKSRKRRSLIQVEKGILSMGQRVLIGDINFHISYGDRMVIVGRNGSGKSSFAKSLVGMPNDIRFSGELRRSENMNTVYIDQKYNIVNPELSLVENVAKHNHEFSPEDVRRQLGRFLFYQEEDVRKKAGVLSGGEVVRLTLAMVTAKPIDLLILDEPTNNIDIETLDIIADALKEFSGALLVISHNIYFLERIYIDRAFIIKEKRLRLMNSSPQESQSFYNEMVGKERKI
ncbi:MAG: ABC-F family ATP-binding cassette domain-containing protein [bacterium]|nr:ABC-F family ATP-binding cassette domain-containing protein [bacterium]